MDPEKIYCVLSDTSLKENRSCWLTFVLLLVPSLKIIILGAILICSSFHAAIPRPPNLNKNKYDCVGAASPEEEISSCTLMSASQQ